jgi:predicted cupin superfamily sugar epimerase
MTLRTRLTAKEVKAMLNLEPHPTCGFVAETYRSPLKIPATALPEAYDEGDRPYGSALYFLVSPDAQIVMHRIRSDQLYHHYMGDPLEVLMLYPDGTGAVATVGSDLAAGERPQLFVPGGTFHTSRLASGDSRYALLASTEWPGVEPPDVEHGNVEELLASFPEMDAQIRAFTG